VVAPQVASTALLDEVVAAWGGRDVELHVSSAVPPGSSLGTSAAVLVALVGALAAVDGERLTPEEAALRAWTAETATGRESGVQDHVAAAFGGVSWIEVGPFPVWRRTPVGVPEGPTATLVTVHLGGSHDSTALHRSVIARAESGDDEVQRVLARLARLAAQARAAIEAGDAAGWGACLTAASEAQARLHPDLVSAPARAAGEAALAAGALGWKVDGAGGHGGCVTVLATGDPMPVLAAVAPHGTLLPLAPSPGLTVT
jgi:D-glycero-alpha-D-manno-heptose-7-phosphate kinase